MFAAETFELASHARIKYLLIVKIVVHLTFSLVQLLVKKVSIVLAQLRLLLFVQLARLLVVLQGRELRLHIPDEL